MQHKQLQNIPFCSHRDNTNPWLLSLPSLEPFPQFPFGKFPLSHYKTDNWTITLCVTLGWIQVAAAPSPLGWKRKIPCCQSREVYLEARGRRKRDQLTWPTLCGMSSVLSPSSSFSSQLCALLILIHSERGLLYCLLFQSCFPGRGNGAAVICGVELEEGDGDGFSVFHVLMGGEWFPM